MERMKALERGMERRKSEERLHIGSSDEVGTHVARWLICMQIGRAHV